VRPRKPAIVARNARIIAMARQGIRPNRIAILMKVAPNIVSVTLWQARQDGVAIPSFGTAGRKKGLGADAAAVALANLGEETRARLTEAGAARGIGAAETARRLLTIVARDGLIDAVLDDGKGGAA
jgi:hypothetical protein